MIDFIWFIINHQRSQNQLHYEINSAHAHREFTVWEIFGIMQSSLIQFFNISPISAMNIYSGTCRYDVSYVWIILFMFITVTVSGVLNS